MSGQVLVATEDHLSALSPEKQRAELAIRGGDPRGSLRGRAVYAFADRRVAERLLADAGGQQLYEMAIEEGDIIHRGDLRIFDEVVEALKAGRCADASIAAYWRGERRASPRVELCARRMTARRRVG